MTFEELMKLKVGDRVMATGKSWFNTKKGNKGTVVDIHEKTVIINWDNNIGGWSDDDYKIEKGHGAFIGATMAGNIKKISNTPKRKLIIECTDNKNTVARYFVDNVLVSKSKTSRNEKYDDFDFKVAVNNCIDRIDLSDKITKGKGLIGKKIKKGQRVRVINVDPHREREKDKYVCLDEYIGKEGVVSEGVSITERLFVISITFDKEYINAIDKENGYLYWRWDEIELID